MDGVGGAEGAGVELCERGEGRRTVKDTGRSDMMMEGGRGRARRLVSLATAPPPY